MNSYALATALHLPSPEHGLVVGMRGEGILPSVRLVIGMAMSRCFDKVVKGDLWSLQTS